RSYPRQSGFICGQFLGRPSGGMMCKTTADEETHMKLTEFLLAELDREVERSRRALAQTPEGKYDWKPHEKSMIFGYLANMVATIPMWVSMQINQDELDIAPKDGGKLERKRLDSSADLIDALDKAAAGAR